MSEQHRSSTDESASELPPDAGSSVAIPDHLQAKIDRRLAETKFDTTDEYVTFVLEAVLRDLEGQPEAGVPTDAETDDGAGDTDAVQDRLESLGYL